MSESVKYTPFGSPIREPVYTDLGKNDGLLPTFELDLDKETGNTQVVQGEPIDLYAEIQSFKDSCGMYAAQQQIAHGLKAPDAFSDLNNPTDYGDISEMPDNINDAYQANQAAAAQANALGIGGIQTQADLDKYVADLVAKQIAAQKAAQTPKEEVK